MERFYQHLLDDGLPASKALREAQLAIRAQPRWSAPRYWAGFVLLGDWK
jgi:CHAT domain-containing protein